MMDWFPWYFVIYKSDTMHLNPYQDGCYRRLIDHYMETRQAIPDNDAAIARIIGDSEANWLAMGSPLIRPFFQSKNGRLFHRKCEQTLNEQDQRSKSLSESGKNGAAKRWNKIKEVDSHPIANPMGFDSTGQDRTIQDKDTPIPPKGDFGFSNWYSIYPHKVGKGAAFKSFQRAIKKTSLEKLIQATEKYIRSKPADRNWCNPATWLNQERWDDVHERQEAKHGYLGM